MKSKQLFVGLWFKSNFQEGQLNLFVVRSTLNLSFGMTSR